MEERLSARPAFASGRGASLLLVWTIAGACATRPAPLSAPAAIVVATTPLPSSAPPPAAVVEDVPAPATSSAVARDEAAPSDDEAIASPAFVCAPPDRGLGRYHPYVPLVRGRLLVPILDAPPPDGAYDVLLHFHFHDAVRRAFVSVAHPIALAGIDLGEGSKGYGDAFADPRAFVLLRASIESALRERSGDPRAHVGKLYLSSWSAGFAASVKILKQAPREISGALFLDSLYAPSERDDGGEPRRGSVFAPAVAPVVALAKRAVRGEAFVFLSYSNAETHGYASTRDVARYLENKLGLREQTEDPGDDPRGAIARVDAGALHVRGFRGVDGRAHCKHLALVRDAIALLKSGAIVESR